MDAAAFYTTFQSLKSDVQAALASGPSKAPAALAQLRTVLAEHRASLPAYDQRSCDSQLRELEVALASQRAEKPKSKFAFKRGAGSSATSVASTASPSPAPTPAPGPRPTLSAALVSSSASPALASAPTPPTTHTLTNLSNTHLSLSDISPTPTGTYTLTLSNLTNCTVDLRTAQVPRSSSSRPTPLAPGQPTLTALHAHNLSRCIVLANIDGSAMLTAVNGGILALKARQFRLHESTGVAVLLEVGSLPVIERCSGIGFGPWHRDVAVDECRVGDGGQGRGSKHAQVQDFDWVRAGPSPHWRELGAAEVEEIQRALLSIEGLAADNILAKVRQSGGLEA